MKSKLHLEFKLKGERNISSRKPLYYEEKIYIAFVFDKKGFIASKVICLNASSFEFVWEIEHDFVINNLLVSNQKSILCCCMDGVILELNPNNGHQINSISTGLERVNAASEIFDNKVVVGGIQGSTETVCIDLCNSNILWRFENGGHSYTPTISQNKVFQTTERTIYCLSLKDGKLLWNAHEALTYLFNPIVWNDFVVVGGHGIINIYQIETGKKLLQININQKEAIYNIVTDNDYIYFGDRGGYFYCYKIDIKQKLFRGEKVVAEQVWKYLSNGSIQSKPALSGNNILIINDGNRLISLNALNGKLNWEFNSKAEAGISGVLVFGNDIYTSVGKGFVYKIKDE